MTGVGVELTDLTRVYGTIRALDGLTLHIHPGEFVALLGPSGCGKTTALRILAGLDEATSGSVSVGGRDVTAVPANKRDMGMVFQAYSLFPHLTARQNVEFGLKVRGRGRADRSRRAGEMLDLVGLSAHVDKYAAEMSGGQQQRVALARALAIEPSVLLLDEPLSALDAKVRISLRDEIRAIQKRLGITTIFVTHDQEEALSMSDRIVVMYGGKAEQTGTPFEIYNRPATRFVASFVGTLNLLEGRVASSDRGAVEVDGQTIELGRPIEAEAGKPITLALRPEAVSLGETNGREQGLSGTIGDVHFLGSVIRVKVGVGRNAVMLDTFNDPASPPPVAGTPARIGFSPRDVLVLTD
jgi:putative spermidine/putrescine transport system ATP-binding protein